MGKFVLDSYTWQAIFYVQAAISVLVTIWFWIRQKETLAPSSYLLKPHELVLLSLGKLRNSLYVLSERNMLLLAFCLVEFVVALLVFFVAALPQLNPLFLASSR